MQQSVAIHPNCDEVVVLVTLENGTVSFNVCSLALFPGPTQLFGMQYWNTWWGLLIKL